MTRRANRRAVGALDAIAQQERRNACGVPGQRQVLDAIGAGMGTFFLVDGYRRLGGRKKERPWAAATLAIGAIMTYVHVQRFTAARPEYCAAAWCAAAQEMRLA